MSVIEELRRKGLAVWTSGPERVEIGGGPKRVESAFAAIVRDRVAKLVREGMGESTAGPIDRAEVVRVLRMVWDGRNDHAWSASAARTMQAVQSLLARLEAEKGPDAAQETTLEAAATFRASGGVEAVAPVKRSPGGILAKWAVITGCDMGSSMDGCTVTITVMEDELRDCAGAMARMAQVRLVVEGED